MWTLLEKKLQVLGQVLNGNTQEELGASSAEELCATNEDSYDEVIRSIVSKVRQEGEEGEGRRE
jgi:hypothetical protein